jgi:subtilisin family serine protease
LGNSHGARRHLIEVRRRRTNWFKTVRGLDALPRLAPQMSLAAAWETYDASDLSIVIPVVPGAGALDLNAGSRAKITPRKRMRTIVHSAGSEDDGTRIVLVSARRAARRLPTVARSHHDRSHIRALYLDRLGLAIMPRLSADQIEAIEEAGAMVVPNEFVTLDDSTSEPTKGVPNTDHLTAIGIDAPRGAGLTGKDVLIGILDTGIDGTHPEFAGKKIEFKSFKHNGDPSRAKMKDYGTHGTHVAALATGRNVGVAPDADLAVAAVLTIKDENGDLGGYTAQILAGLNWLADVNQRPKPVDIINASLGHKTDDASYHGAVLGHRLAGTLTIAAIGNSGTHAQHCSPAKLDCAVGVGAVDNNGIVATFSDWGPTYASGAASTEYKPDLMAPGVDVESAVPKKGYARKSGTSMATPLVSGAAALLLERDPSLRNNPSDLCATLYQLVDALPAQAAGYDTRRGGRGRLDLKTLS